MPYSFTQHARPIDPGAGLSRINNARVFKMLYAILLILVSSLLIITRCKDEQDDVPSVW